MTEGSSSRAERAERAGLRERKKAATRQALSAAALRLAVERGLDNLLVEDIAAEVNVSTRTFNNYFSSKYEAICSTGLDRAQRIGDALRGRPAKEPLWDAITKAVLEHYEGMDVALDRETVAAVLLVMTSPQIRGEYLKIDAAMQLVLASAIADRAGIDIQRDMFPEILAGAVTAASQVAIRRWIAADPPVPLRPLLRRALRQLATACSPRAVSDTPSGRDPLP
jgi:AcrR family transcriptional regulator